MIHDMYDIKKEMTDQRILHLICNGNRIYSDDTKSNKAAVPASFATLQCYEENKCTYEYRVCEWMYNEGSRNILPEKQQLLKSISLSANTVADHVNDSFL